MIEILHYFKGPTLWNYGLFLIKGNAGSLSSAVQGCGVLQGLEIL